MFTHITTPRQAHQNLQEIQQELFKHAHNDNDNTSTAAQAAQQLYDCIQAKKELLSHHSELFQPNSNEPCPAFVI